MKSSQKKISFIHCIYYLQFLIFNLVSKVTAAHITTTFIYDLVTCQSHRVLGGWRGIGAHVITFSLFPGQAWVMSVWEVPLEFMNSGKGMRLCIWV